MTVTYHSGRRIQGTQADFDGTPAVSGGWKELGRHTLGSNTAPITVSTLPDKQYYMVLRSWSGNTGLYERFNNDSGNNYSSRRAQNGNTDYDLEDSMTTNKEIREYESPEDIDYLYRY